MDTRRITEISEVEKFEQAIERSEIYTATDDFTGLECRHRRQRLTIIRAARITHGPTFPNRQIIARALVAGKRGAQYKAFVMVDGQIVVIA